MYRILAASSPVVLYPFRYRDALTGRWVRTGYVAELNEIAARYAEWEIIGPLELRRPLGASFSPWRKV